MPAKRFRAFSIGYLMLSMLLSIIVGEQSHEAGVHNLLEIDPVLNAFYAGLKMLMGAAYLWFLRNSLLEIGGIVALPFWCVISPKARLPLRSLGR